MSEPTSASEPIPAQPAAEPSTVGRAWGWLWSFATPGEAFGMRALMALGLIGSLLWLQWITPAGAHVPSSIVGAAGICTGYYLTGDSAPTMKAVVSLGYVGFFIAFVLRHGADPQLEVPETITSQVTTVMGIYFGAAHARALNGK